MPLPRLNFLFINTDQQRADSLGCYGNRVARTPHLDQLAADGVRFAQCYTTNPVCMPARASWWTGQYPSRHGTWQNGVPLAPSADTLQRRLKTAGYHTALIGKIHLDNIWQRTEKHPSYDFDLLIECEGDPYCKDDYFQWLEQQGRYETYMAQFKREGHRNGYTRDLPEDLHMNNWITAHAEEYLAVRAQDHQPFFLSLGFFDPHHPFDPCEPYASQFDPAAIPLPPYQPGEEDRMPPPARRRFDSNRHHALDADAIRGTIAAYHAMITHIDAMVGRVLRKLRETGLDEKTVVIFTSDHGEMLGDHGHLHKGPMFYDAAIRVPLIYQFPPQVDAHGTVDSFVSHTDLAPTVTALAGCQPPDRVQGLPLFDAHGHLLPLGRRNAASVEWRDRAVDADGPYEIARCLVTERWKYVTYPDEDVGELYDRVNDPGEIENLWQHPGLADVRAELDRLRSEFCTEPEVLPARTNIF